MRLVRICVCVRQNHSKEVNEWRMKEATTKRVSRGTTARTVLKSGGIASVKIIIIIISKFQLKNLSELKLKLVFWCMQVFNTFF